MYLDFKIFLKENRLLLQFNYDSIKINELKYIL